MTGVVLITGGSRGIGAEVARLAAQRGYSVAINFRRGREAAESLVKEIQTGGGRAAAFRADVAFDREVRNLFLRVESQMGPPVALVNSAGISPPPQFAIDFDANELQELFAINLVGTMLCCREAIKRMAKSQGGKGGSIVNVSSMAATIGGRQGSSHYAASKAAVDCFTVGLAKEVAEEGIRVNAVRPGMTRTDMTAELAQDADCRRRTEETIAMRRFAEAKEVAAPVLWLLSQEASFVSGALIDVSGGGFVIYGGREPEP